MTWDKATLGDVCNIEKGNIGILKATKGDYPLVVLGEERRTHNQYQFDGDAVVIPLVSSTGHGDRSMKRIHFQSGKFSVGSILCAVMPKDSSVLSAEFLFRYLDLNKEGELVSRMKGMANVSLSVKSIAEVEIPLPPIEVQRGIVQAFKNIETKTNSLSSEYPQQLDLLKSLRQQILQDAVQGKLVPQDPNDEPASKLLERIKAEKEQLIQEKKIKQDKSLPEIKPEEIPFEIPENWVWCRLGNLTIELLGGFAFDSTRYCKHSTNQVLRLGNVKPNQLAIDSSPVYIDDDYANEALKSKLTKGDVLITMTGTRAKRDYLFTLCLSSEAFHHKNLFLNQRIGCFRFGKFVSNEFINNVLKDGRLLNVVYESSTGAANQANIGITALKEMLIPLPPISEQNQINIKSQQLMKLCDELEYSIQQNQIYTQDLLQVALKEALEPQEN